MNVIPHVAFIFHATPSEALQEPGRQSHSFMLKCVPPGDAGSQCFRMIFAIKILCSKVPFPAHRQSISLHGRKEKDGLWYSII